MTERFHERFDIQLDVAEARRRFVNRVINTIFALCSQSAAVSSAVANALGEEYIKRFPINRYVNDDFYKCLQAIEVCYDRSRYLDWGTQVEASIRAVLGENEVDFGIRWEDGKFVRAGARLLDQQLVNEPLRWLGDRKYENVRIPFEKGLTHFLNAEKQPELLPDVVTDMYESLEALSKIVTGRPEKDLSAGRELFIKNIGASDHYKTILKDYIDYACEFRHGAGEGKAKPALSTNEVESFVYLTGLFIRLAITSIQSTGTGV